MRAHERMIAAACAALALTASAAPVRVSEKFGYDPADATKNLQAALDSGLPEILVDAKETPWIVNPLFARSNQKIIFEKGTVLLAKRGEYRGQNDYLLLLRNCTNTVVVGNGATFRMWREDYAHGKDGDGKDYRRGQWRHTLAILGSRRVTVDGLVLEESGGDGIYIADGNGCEQPVEKPFRSISQDIVVRNCVCDRHHRQGMSIICGINVLVENCVFKNTKGTPPEAGVDIEPNLASDYCINIVLRNCLSQNNAGNGFEVALMALRKGPDVGVRFENCRSVGDRRGALIRTSVDPKIGNYPTGSVVYDQCAFAKTQWTAIEVNQVPEKAFEMRFDNCRFEEIGTRSPGLPLVVLYSAYDDDPKPALPKMTNCQWPDRGDRSMFVYDLLDPKALGVETLPVVPVDLTKARVVDTQPGKFVSFSPIAIRNHAKYYVYADRSRDITLGVTQVKVGRADRPALNGKADIISVADGTKVATRYYPNYDGRMLSFRAPKAGFYSLEFTLKQKRRFYNGMALTGSNAPVALEVAAGHSESGRKWPINLFEPEGSFFVPVAAGERAEFRMKGDLPGERVGAAVIDPSGKTAFASPSLLYAEHYLTPKSDRDGVWELRLGQPAKGGPSEDSLYELAGVQPLFFPSKEKCWFGK